MTVKDDIKALIDAHCQAHAEYRNERYRVAMAEMSGQPDAETVASVEKSLTRVYALLHESSERLAQISAMVEFTEGENDGR